MSNEYNVKLLVKQTKLNAISINSANVNSHNKKYSGFKDLLKDNIPESLNDYNGNTYDISSVFHDTNWSSTDNTKTPSTNSSQSNQKFSQIETNANLELYKNAKLVPHEDASGTTHKLWTVYDDASNNLLEHMVDFSFDISGSYLPILTYYNGSAYVESTMFSDPLWWLIDYENHAISFFNTDSVLNGGTVNVSAGSANPPKLTFYRYIGKTKVNNKLSVEGDISCNEVIVSGTTLTNKLSVIDASYVDLSGVVTTNIASIASNTLSFTNRKITVDNSFNDLSNNISKLDISYVDLSGVVTANIGNIAAKAPKASPTFTGNVGIGTTVPQEKLHIDGSILLNGFGNAATGIYFREGYGSSTTDKYNNSIFTYNHYGGGNTNDGISINGYDGVSICTGSNNRQERMIINQSGYVGIGTSSPKEKLEIYKLNASGSTTYNAANEIGGNILLSYHSSFPAAAISSITTPSGSYNGQMGFFTWRRYGTNTSASVGIPTPNIYNNTSGALVEAMRIDHSGNVGIGTSIPEAKLDIQGSNDVCLRLRGYGGPGDTQGKTGIAFHIVQSDVSYPLSTHKPYAEIITEEISNSSKQGNLLFKIKQSNYYDTAPTTAMILDYNGNVGIGTTSPDEILQLGDGNIKLSKTTGSDWISTTDPKPIRKLIADPGERKAIWWNYSNEGTEIRDNNTIKFMTGGVGADDHIERMVINSSGKVGIGITDPKSYLTVYGNNTKTVTGTALLQIGGNSYGSTHKQYLKMGSYDSGDSSTSFSWMQTFRQTTSNSGGYTPLSINSHGGYVGIGTDSPSFPLEISSTDNDVVIPNGGYFASNGTANAWTGTSTRGISLKINSGGIWITGGWGYYTTSDQRIKENIHDVSDNDALQKLRDISCCFYEYKDKISKGNDKTIGFIAQQVKEHMPMAVSIKKDIIPNEMRKLIDYSWNQIADASGNYDSSNNQYKLTIHDLSDNLGNSLYRFYVSNDPSGNDEVRKEIKSLEDDPKSFVFDQSWNNVFLYGKEVDDLHILDKNKLFALNFSATQEIDRIQQAEKTKLVAAEAKITALETENAALKSRIEAIEAHLGLNQ